MFSNDGEEAASLTACSVLSGLTNNPPLLLTHQFFVCVCVVNIPIHPITPNLKINTTYFSPWVYISERPPLPHSKVLVSHDLTDLTDTRRWVLKGCTLQSPNAWVYFARTE